MRTDLWPRRKSFGTRYTTTIMLPILKLALDRFIVGGVAVDATLVDTWNRPVRMPSDFDDFTPASMWRYAGPHADIRAHVRLLQIAMQNAGFWGLRTEWWHFTIADWQKYLPYHVARTAEVCGTQWQGKL
jgi:D-alanyl-D-alanine dipeptidase